MRIILRHIYNTQADGQMPGKLGLVEVPLSWARRVAHQAYQLATDFPSGHVRQAVSCLESLLQSGKAPLHHPGRKYNTCKDLGIKLVVLCWEPFRAFLSVLVELALVAYKLMLVIMVNNPQSKTEENVPQLIEAHGYKVETHTITTEDGYILEMHRIPSKGRAVFLMHGMLCSSYCWVTSGAESLAFILADAGYDVWMGNFRGTKYGRVHQHMDPDKDQQFWRFTLHELGVKDISAMISNVISITEKPSLSFIGHSMGTTSFLILASTQPDLVSKVDLAILMAPVVEPHNMKNMIGYLSYVANTLKNILEYVGILEILPASLLIEKLTWDHIGHMCLKLQLRGPIMSTDDKKMLNRICHHARTSKTSFYTVLHYAQNIINKCFHAFDWHDPAENLRRYGSEKPPTYDLSRVSVPSALFWSSKDSLSSREDMEKIVSELPNLVSCKEVYIGHLDYLWGANVKGDLYYDLLESLAKVESSHTREDSSRSLL